MPAHSHVLGFPRRTLRLCRRPLSLVVGTWFALQFSKVRLVVILKTVLLLLEIVLPCSLLLLRENPTAAAANGPDEATCTRNQDGNYEDHEHQSIAS